MSRRLIDTHPRNGSGTTPTITAIRNFIPLCTLLGLDFYRDEAAAYADLGRAVQEIHREIPSLGDTE
jgi:hypothetical protein